MEPAVDCCVDRPPCHVILIQPSPSSPPPVTYLWLLSATCRPVKPILIYPWDGQLYSLPSAHLLPYGTTNSSHCCPHPLRGTGRCSCPRILTGMKSGTRESRANGKGFFSWRNAGRQETAGVKQKQPGQTTTLGHPRWDLLRAQKRGASLP